MLQAMLKLACILECAIRPVRFPSAMVQRFTPITLVLRHIIVKVCSALKSIENERGRKNRSAFALFFAHMSVAYIVKAAISSIVNAFSMHFISFPVSMVLFTVLKLIDTLAISQSFY